MKSVSEVVMFATATAVNAAIVIGAAFVVAWMSAI